MSQRSICPGKPYPLGATFDGKGTNFALFSEQATGVELLFFDEPYDEKPKEIILLKERTAFVWHGYVPHVAPSQLYAFRVDGLYQPEKGHRFNKHKLLLDPYARAIAGKFQWNDALFGYTIGDKKDDLSFDKRDSAQYVPKCVVIDNAFDWEGDTLLKIPWSKTIIYEVHVKGFTKTHPDIEEKKRGTYAGFCSLPVIEYLKKLGVTAVELLPVHQHADEPLFQDKGLSNYWGYNTVSFFAPECSYASSGHKGEQVREFKEMVKVIHKAGIEVILDVVYNHTAESNQWGPTLCFRGIDNFSYYYLNPQDLRQHIDFTGCGNGLRMSNPYVTQLVMDSLRYWILEMHVDGFRFDLASALARELYDVDKLAAFFDIIHQDPVISQVKLIAEPWDLGAGGYQVGNFPVLWAEWNGKYRDAIRRFWKGEECNMAEIARRLSGSSDLYQDDGRNPYASINFVTCHDGFTLHDIVSYNQKDNEANQENNRDGTDSNMSWNCGVEGPTEDKEIMALREKQKRNILATLLLSQGVPMILGGDEMGRTQQGNNNAYCQDNELSWYSWKVDTAKQQLFEFTRKLVGLRKNHQVFRRSKFFKGQKPENTERKDITWFKPDGAEMNDVDWNYSCIRTVGMLLAGDALDEYNEQGELILDDDFLVLFNAHYQVVQFKLPEAKKPWELIVSTLDNQPRETEMLQESGKAFSLEGRSIAVFYGNQKEKNVI